MSGMETRIDSICREISELSLVLWSMRLHTTETLPFHLLQVLTTKKLAIHQTLQIGNELT